MVDLVPNRTASGWCSGRQGGRSGSRINAQASDGCRLHLHVCDPDRGLSRAPGSSRTRMAPPSVRTKHQAGHLPGGRAAKERTMRDVPVLQALPSCSIVASPPGPAADPCADVRVEQLDHRQLLSVNFTGNVPDDFPATQSPGVVVLPLNLSNPQTLVPVIPPNLQPFIPVSGFYISGHPRHVRLVQRYPVPRPRPAGQPTPRPGRGHRRRSGR